MFESLSGMLERLFRELMRGEMIAFVMRGGSSQVSICRQVVQFSESLGSVHNQLRVLR
jgi:hypothetical protein